MRFSLFGVFPGVKFIECENAFERFSDFLHVVVQEVAHENVNFKGFFFLNMIKNLYA